MENELKKWFVGNRVTKLTQTRLKTDTQRGNCYPTSIACLMGLSDTEEVIQFQDLYDNEDESWYSSLMDWLEDRGLELNDLEGHLDDGTIYMVSGKTIRESSHVCLYKNGKLWHDPHPSGDGLISEDSFRNLKIIKNNLKWENEGFCPKHAIS